MMRDSACWVGQSFFCYIDECLLKWQQMLRLVGWSIVFLLANIKDVHGYIAWWVAAQNFWFSRVFGCSLGRSVGEPFGESGFVLPSHFESASVQRNLAVVEPATKILLNLLAGSVVKFSEKHKNEILQQLNLHKHINLISTQTSCSCNLQEKI